MKTFPLIMGCLLISLQAFPQFQSTPLKNVTKSEEGIKYTLPKTMFEIQVETRRTTEIPGPYALYAERFLGIKDVVLAEKTTWELVSIQIKPKAVPDPGQVYVITPMNSHQTVQLTPDGLLLSLNGEVKQPTEIKANSLSFKQKEANESASDADQKSYWTQEKSIYTRDMQQATSSARVAELAAMQLFDLRESRLSLLSQETDHTPSDGKSYETVLSELNRMENYYTELFTGKKQVTNHTTILEIEPTKAEETILFRFNPLQGILDKADLGGSPVFMQLTPVETSVPTTPITASRKKPAEIGLYYRMPATIQVRIADAKQEFVKKNIQVAQMGWIQTLPVSLTGKVVLDTATGTVLTVGN